MAKITSVNGKSIAQQIVSILNRSLPQVSNTGIFTHCRGINTPKEGKGKVVNFEFQHRYFRISENLKVAEYAYGFNCRNVLSTNEVTQDIESRIALAL